MEHLPTLTRNQVRSTGSTARPCGRPFSRPLILPIVASRTAAYLAGQQLIRRRQGERRPGRDHLADQGGLGHGDIGARLATLPATSSATHPIVIRRIHRSAPALTGNPRESAHQ
jgi:hypothetical protein